ncbi:MAG: TraR/DksA family transcriptional regulator [Proteobacteria bacterium]|nr:TraR/DksA family transcriptional regulator [Pseudomonadota bacterium]
MTDIADRAAEREEELIGDALDEHRRHDPTAGKTEADSAKWCDGCGQRVPDARRKAVPGVRLCVDCQNEAARVEAAAKRNGRHA